MSSTKKKRIAVLRGGQSSEHRASLATGKQVLAHLDTAIFSPVDIYIDRAGVWYEDGAPVDPYTMLQFMDGVFNALHGEYGEDGTVQSLLDDIGIAHTGSSALASKLAIDKQQTKLLVSQQGIVVPRGTIMRSSSKDHESQLAALWRTHHHPLIVKPNASGSSVGVSLVRDFASLVAAATYILATGHDALVEEYISGQEVSVSIIANMRREALYAAVPGHIKYEGQYLANAAQNAANYSVEPMKQFSSTERDLVIRIAKHVHSILGLSGYSRSDFIVSKKGIYFLEVNTLPGLSPHSIFTRTLEESGIKMQDFLTHVIGE
jgi:D-alanine-D-alanine ligase